MTAQTPSFVDTVNADVASALQTAGQLATPIYDAVGNALGWIAGEAAPYVGTGTAVTVTNDIGQAIGFVVDTDQTAASLGYQAGAIALTPVYDGGGQLLGNFFETAGKAIGGAAVNLLQIGLVVLVAVLALNDLMAE